MDNNQNQNNNTNSQSQNNQIKKAETHEASKNAAHTVGKGLATYYGGAAGNKLYEAASQTKLGQAIEKAAAKAIESDPLSRKSSLNALNKSGALDAANKVIDASSGSGGKISNGGTSGINSNSFKNKNMLKGAQAKTSMPSANNSNFNNINSINRGHNLVEPPKDLDISEEEQEYLDEQNEIAQAYQQELLEEQILQEQEMLEQQEKEEKKKKEKAKAKAIIKLLLEHPAGMFVVGGAVLLVILIFWFIYMVISDMDIVGTEMSEYSEAEIMSGYCSEIWLIKEHPDFTGPVATNIDDIDLEEKFTLNKKSENRWSYKIYDLETYTKGVVQAEAIAVNDEKTFEVAAIAARTYALQITSKRCFTWDNTNKRTQYRNPQNFTPDTVDSKVSSAVEQTNGLVVSLDEKLLNMSNGNYYDYFCNEGKDVDEEQNSFYQMLQENEEEKLLIPTEWAKDNNAEGYTYSGKYDGQCQKEGMSLFGAKYLLNKEADPYTTIRIIKYYYGYDTVLKKVITATYGNDCFQWPTTSTNITSNFGPRKSPTAGASSNHGGIDIGVPIGTNVFATSAGTVKLAGTAGGYGQAVYIDHGNGLVSRYGHLQAGGIKVSVGQTVTAGQVIALSGNTGISTGPHLHFEMQLNGVKVNPLNYVSTNSSSSANCGLYSPGGNSSNPFTGQYSGKGNADFIKFIAMYAVQDMHNSGILASITIAQAALESGWGKSMLARNYNNFFGMKAGSSWNGPTAVLGTTECNGNNCYKTSATWRVYSNPLESIKDHSRLLQTKRYNAVVGVKDYKTAITIIKNSGYATDPNYINKIIAIIEANDLAKYDRM